ncbi:HipA domain-containing protein [Hymenobacter terricola]|uniref:HipA domain-containing protein n=1 Tax=Hymenobacter terricola TaxID=2819236 RepID=UPI001CF2206F
MTELWRRIVFNICVAFTDDHLRNHGFILSAQGRRLSPAYDLNPMPYGRGLTLNISETDNAPALQLALEVALFFRLLPRQANAIIAKVSGAVRNWRAVAMHSHLTREEQELMANAFRAVDN